MASRPARYALSLDASEKTEQPRNETVRLFQLMRAVGKSSILTGSPFPSVME